MKTGDIVFIKGESWISSLIRYFDKGDFTHVGIAVSETELIEAQRFTRVRVHPIGEVSYEVVDLHLNEEETNRMLVEAYKMLGMRYDYLQIAGYMFRHAFGLTGSGWFNLPNRLICSEMVSYSVYRAGLTETMDKLRDLKPNQLYDYLKYLGKERRSQ